MLTNQMHLGKVWMYDITSGAMLQVARHESDCFIDTDRSTQWLLMLERTGRNFLAELTRIAIRELAGSV
jgi:hypothetical protein